MSKDQNPQPQNEQVTEGVEQFSFQEETLGGHIQKSYTPYDHTPTLPVIQQVPVELPAEKPPKQE